MTKEDSTQPNTKILYRRKNRQIAVQFLYAWEINSSEILSSNIEAFFDSINEPIDKHTFAVELIHGAVEKLSEVDSYIVRFAQNWKFERISKVDLAILRLAIYEMLHRMDIPPIVSINEAIELTKVLSQPESKRFINGMLDEFKKELKRPLRQASES